MDDSLPATCRFPTLSVRYDRALRQAVAYICAHFEPIGIIASGTIIRGNPDPTSDLDIFIIHRAPARQRLQRLFNGVPAELFVNPPHQIEEYFRTEHEAGRPSTAHMLATGFVIMSRDPIIDVLQRKAQRMLETPPDYSAQHLIMSRYGAATVYEDALDVAATDLSTAQLLLNRAVDGMLTFALKNAGQFLPRSKELLDTVSAMDPHTGSLARSFWQASSLEERLQLAAQLADCTIKSRGFFEWDSEPQECLQTPEPSLQTPEPKPGRRPG